MPKTILVAAADPNITYLLQRYAQASGFQAVMTSQGRSTLDMAREAQPSLIILEVEPPDTHGWHTLCSLKAEPQTQDIPVVVYSFMDDTTHHPQQDVAGYLKTSVLYDDFLSMLDQVGVQP